MTFPIERPRRLRQSPAMRRLVAETRLHPAGLVLPVFVREGIDSPSPISSLPGVVQHSRASVIDAAREAYLLGLGGVMVFGVTAGVWETCGGETGPLGAGCSTTANS